MIVDELIERRIRIRRRCRRRRPCRKVRGSRCDISRGTPRCPRGRRVPEKRQQRAEDEAPGRLRHVVEPGVVESLRVVAEAEDRIQIVRDELHPPLAARGRHEIHRVVVVHAVRDFRLEILQDRHHRKPARPLIQIRDRLERRDFRGGESRAVPCAVAAERVPLLLRDIVRRRAGKMRRGAACRLGKTP